MQVAVLDSALAGVGAAQALSKTAGTGLSQTFTYAIPADPLAIPGGMEGLKSFNLVAGGAPVVPEPTTIALGALGAAALLLRRRK
jgi:hypothetical protein